MKLKSYFYGAVIIGMTIGNGFIQESYAVSKFILNMKPAEIQIVHNILKERIEQAQNIQEKEFLERDLQKFEKYYISPENYILEYAIQDLKGEQKSFNILATTNENKRFSNAYPCEAKDTFNGEKLYVQPKLDFDKDGTLSIKVNVVLGREEFVFFMPYKSGAEVAQDHKSAKGPLRSTAKLKIKKGFFGL